MDGVRVVRAERFLAQEQNREDGRGRRERCSRSDPVLPHDTGLEEHRLEAEDDQCRRRAKPELE